MVNLLQNINAYEYILLIEDNEVLSKILIERLNDAVGLRVLHAKTYKMAEQLLNEYGSNIVIGILDLVLPDAKDFDVIELVTKYNIQSMVFTGNFDEELQQKILSYPIVSCYCLKENVISVDIAVKNIARLLKNREVDVLLVDDSKTTLMMYGKMLKRQNLRPYYAMNGEEALKILSDHPEIRLVLTDYNMPVMDGLTLTSKIREKHSAEDLAIIVTSSSEQTGISVKFLKYGANDFITKPVVYEELCARINMNLTMLDMIQQMKDRSDKDFMTGLYNRRYFYSSGQKLYNEKRKSSSNITVAMFDIDKFKNINDTYGHDIGDIAIIKLADILSTNLKVSQFEYILSRFGGEEFCLILFDADLEQSKTLLENIRLAVENNIIYLEDLNLSFTLSAGAIGVNSFSLDEAVKLADKNLYEAKQTGRNRVVIN